MKILCSCGTKYAFDTTPEMARSPIQFVCQTCGADSSELVNRMIREEYGVSESAPPAAPIAPPQPAVALPSPAAPAPVAPRASGIRLAAHSPASSPTASAPPAETAPRVCGKHPGEAVTHACVVCQKPLCPLCMRITGFVCSPFCRTKADGQGIHVPHYEFQRDVATRKQWRKVSLIAGGVGVLVAIALGFWFWYAWFGSVPRVVYSHRFANLGYTGRMQVVAPNQIVVLHGGTLSRHDLANHKLIWSLQLVDSNRIAAATVTELAAMKDARDRAVREGADSDAFRLPTLDRLTKDNIRSADAALALHISDQNIWLISPGKATRYAWADGRTDKEIPIDETLGEPKRSGQELVFLGVSAGGKESSLRLDLNSGESKSEGLAQPTATVAASAARPKSGSSSRNPGVAGTGSAGTAGTSKTLDPAALAARAQNLPMPNRVALPATIAAAENQRRLGAAMRDEDDVAPVTPARSKGRPKSYPEVTQRVRTASGTIEFATRLLEVKIVQREAMKAAPSKPALDGNVTAGNGLEVANALLNEMQRERGGSTVEEDESRYQITVRRGASTPWTGEVAGSPSLHPLKSIDLVTGGKTLVALDKENKKLWDAKLSFPIVGGSPPGDSDDLEAGGPQGQGPCVERGDIVFVCDQGMLTSFARANGAVRWRLPSVGITGLWFDDRGMIYVNSTTASSDAIKYSKQIDLSAKTRSAVLKVDPETGRTIWSTLNEGMVAYLSGPFIYTAESHGGDDFDEEDRVMGIQTGLEVPAHIRLKRLDPGKGRVLWEHYQKRFPLEVQFDRNTIRLLFKREVQELKFMVF